MSDQTPSNVPLASRGNESRSQSPPPAAQSHRRVKKLMFVLLGLVVIAAVLVAVLVTAPWDNGSSSSGAVDGTDSAGRSGEEGPAPVPAPAPSTPAPTPAPSGDSDEERDDCGDTYMYSSLPNNVLDGTLDNFMYGPKSNNTDCCSILGCVSATVTTYECASDNGPPLLLYELQCCEKTNQRNCFSDPISIVLEPSSIIAPSSLGARLNDDPDMFLGCTFRDVTKDVACAPLEEGSDKSYVNLQYIPEDTEEPTEEVTEEPTEEVTEEPTEEVTEEPEPSEEPTEEVTEEPEPSEEPTEEPEQCVLPPDKALACPICAQDNSIEALPGVKVGGCLQVVCMPTSIPVGAKFHTRVRWCLQRPRRAQINFDLLDLGYGKDFFISENTKNDPFVVDNPAYPYTQEDFPMGYSQCAEHTFELNLDIEPTKYPPGEDPPPGAPLYNVMWKFFIAPEWGGGAGGGPGENHDPFPNMLSESGVPYQPAYTQGGEVQGDCPTQPTIFWNLPPTGKQDAINFPEFPPCIPRGFAGFQGYTLQVWTHVESMDTANLHVNLMGGTGGDSYLGAEDVYFADSPDPIDAKGNFAPISKNDVTEYYEDGYWNVHTITFSQAQLQTAVNWAEENGKWPNTYFTAFLVPDGDTYEERQENGDFIRDDEGNIIYNAKLNYEDDGVTPKVDCRYLDDSGGCMPVYGYDARELEHMFQVELCDDPRQIDGFIPECDYPTDCEGNDI